MNKRNIIMASGCQICTTTGQCSLAFHNGPGQYCGQWFDRSTETNKPCCCPLLQVGMQTTCNMSATQCKCHVYGSQDNRPTDYVNDYKNWDRNPSSLPPWVHGVLPIIFVILCCLTCCRFPKRHHHQHGDVPIARAVHVDESCPPPPENPSYYGSISHHYHDHHDNSGSGNAIASGLGGFAIGTILGDLIGRNAAGGGVHRGEDDYHTPYGGGGGYDIIGDSGGYDTVGDSGGYDTGGYDIQGDS